MQRELTVKALSRVLVIGGSGGIGSAVVDLLADDFDLRIGVHSALNPARSSGVSMAIRKQLEVAEDCFSVVDSFVEYFEGIDHLIVCLGSVSQRSDPLDIEVSAWDRDLFVNLSAPFFLAQRALATMISQGTGGSIVLFGTESARHGGGPTSLAYGVAKHGIECAVKGLARRAAPHGVRVNMICPGFIASGFHQRWQLLSESDISERVGRIPLGRAGAPSEVAFLAAYLMSEQASFITGETFSISGGDWL